MRNTLDFTEIANWREFENLIAAYFREVEKEKNIIDIQVDPSGIGPDGGRDILITFQMTDSIIPFARKWVVQCKFYDKVVSKADLATINIPSLIHEYGADGYLLVCKGDVSSTVTDMFENLRRECRLGYSYMIWTGDQLKRMLTVKPALFATYFPKFNEFLQSKGTTHVI